MKLNKSNGEFKFNEWSFSPEDTLKDIQENFSTEEFEIWTSNAPSVSYRLNISKEYKFIIMFYRDSIKFIEIYPLSGARELHEILEDLGGEKTYSWGKIEISKDLKAGYESILITYSH